MPIINSNTTPRQLDKLEISKLQHELSSISQKKSENSKYLNWGELNSAGLTGVWTSAMEKLEKFENYSNAQALAKSRIKSQSNNLELLTSEATKFKSYVINDSPFSGRLRLNDYAKNILQIVQHTLNANESGVPIFGSFNQTSNPVKDLLTNTVWIEDPSSSNPQTTAQKFFAIDTSLYTDDTELSNVVKISSSQVELNIPVTSDAFKNLVGALQIFYQSGYPTSDESKERGEKLLDQAISQLIDLKSATDSRLELFDPASKEIGLERESASHSYQEIFGFDITDSMIAAAQIQSALKLSYIMLAMQLKTPSIIDSFG